MAIVDQLTSTVVAVAPVHINQPEVVKYARSVAFMFAFTCYSQD